MKNKIAAALLAACLLIPTSSVSAATGDIIGHVYASDIRAFINNVEVKAYNIGGKTAVVIEEIWNESGYAYDDASRTLKLDSFDPSFLTEAAESTDAPIGSMVGNVYETDIKTSIYGVTLPSYNIGGKTAVAIEDLGYDRAFSPIGGRYFWSDTDRTIRLEFLYPTACGLSSDRDITVTFNETGTEATATFEEKFHCGGGREHFVFPDGMNADSAVIVPIKTLNETWLGCYFRRPGEDNKTVEFTYWYQEKVKDAEKIYKPAPVKTREEMLEHFIGAHSLGAPLQRLDIEHYSFIYIAVAGTSWTSYNLVQAYDDGTYIDYKDRIQMKNRAPSDLKIDEENQTVTFTFADRYHPDRFTNYEIDLKSATVKAIEGTNFAE